MNYNRLRTIKEGGEKKGPVVYWMSRDQRSRDNWALLWAQGLAIKYGEPLIVMFCLVSEFLNATQRQYGFMLKGLREVARSLEEKNIPFCLLTGTPDRVIPAWLIRHSFRAVITDFDPLHIKRLWKLRVSKKVDIPVYEIDAHNIVPCWLVSQKQEYGAYTIRPKIRKVLQDYLEEFPQLKRHPILWRKKIPTYDWNEIESSINVDTSVPEINWVRPGEKEAHNVLTTFIKHKLSYYQQLRNDPSVDGQSHLSPYLHFGQLSAQRAALEIMRADAKGDVKDAILEELIVRRELSDNFCYYNKDYDNFNGFPEWAKKTLDKHRKDSREFMYSPDLFERAETHDQLWNAAQMEMVKRGKMHGYMRMYWAKKILEWTPTPEMALDVAIYLNDKYELDGRDPNGYTGIAWSIGGVHDRAWNERSTFGKVRYMSYNGCKSKFNIQRYIERINAL